MYDRFTDRARKVMGLAHQEACRLNHEYIGTEHVLLGLIKEGNGVGATILRNYDLSIKILREDVEKLVKPGPDMVTMGKLPQTPRTKKIIEYAMEYARSLKHKYLGTEHLLYGLTQEKDGIAMQILVGRGFDEKTIKKDLESLLGVSSQSEEVQKTEKDKDYWQIPRKDMNLEKFLEISGYLTERGKEPDYKIKIMKTDPDKQVVDNILVGEFYYGEDPFYVNNVKVIYDFNNKKQLGFALDLRDVFDNNWIEHEEKPSSEEVLRELKKPVKSIVSLIERLEKRV